jgi:hypothetical protein
LTGTAVADTSLSTTVGPVTIPSVPVSVCVCVHRDLVAARTAP